MTVNEVMTIHWTYVDSLSTVQGMRCHLVSTDIHHQFIWLWSSLVMSKLQTLCNTLSRFFILCRIVHGKIGVIWLNQYNHCLIIINNWQLMSIINSLKYINSLLLNEYNIDKKLISKKEIQKKKGLSLSLFLSISLSLSLSACPQMNNKYKAGLCFKNTYVKVSNP